MDKIILKNFKKKAIIEQCGNCIRSSDKDLQGLKVPDGWIWCKLWMGNKPNSGWCTEFRT